MDVTAGGIITNLVSDIVTRIYDKNSDRLEGTWIANKLKHVGLIPETFADKLKPYIERALLALFESEPQYIGDDKIGKYFISPAIVYCIREYVFKGEMLNDEELEAKFTELLASKSDLRHLSLNPQKIYEKFQTYLISELDSKQSPDTFLMRNDFAERVEKLNKLFLDGIEKLKSGQDRIEGKLDQLIAEKTSVYEYSVSGLSATLATRPTHLKEKPTILFGRETLLVEVRILLDQQQRVLLQGFGGMGKTALAASVAAQWINDGNGSVLWLKAGSAELDALTEGLARTFDAHQAIARLSGDAKLNALGDLLLDKKITLLVLDDCWNGNAADNLLKAIPSEIALLATARQRHPLRECEIIDVDELSNNDALELLKHHARNINDNQLVDAKKLCVLLGHHAFAIEIAGKTLKSQNWKPIELYQSIQDAPDKASVPLITEAGRENVAKLLEVSLNALDEETRNVFLAFGAFFAPQLTPEMLQLYFDGSSGSSSQGERLGMRTTSLLNTLHLHGLADRISTTDESVTAYRIHDLSYSFTRSRINDEHRYRALQACLGYTENYKTPSLSNFKALQPELDNLLGAASWAFEIGQYAAVHRFASILYAKNRFFEYRGFHNEAVQLLKQAVNAANLTGNRRNQSVHLGHLGNVYHALGEVEQAVTCYQQSLTISREIGDKVGERNQLGSLGNIYRALGEVTQAITYFEQALIIQDDIGDEDGYVRLITSLGNLHLELGEVEQAIKYYQQALIIQRDIGDKSVEGTLLSSLGVAYYSLGEIQEAIHYFHQALSLSREIGDKMNEGIQLGNLGNVNRDLGHLQPAIIYYQQAREIFSAIGAQHRVIKIDDLIARVQANFYDEPPT